MAEKILITGASGFIGSFIVEEALTRGMETWAAVRPGSSRQFLTDDRIRFVELDLASEEILKQQLQGLSFDYVVHAAGVTKCLDRQDFFRTNTEGTQHLVRALMALGMPLKRFVYISSLSVMGAIRERQPYTEIRDDDEPRPNTAYGQSKLQAERWLDGVDGLPYVVLRPTGVYGPRERDYYMMAKSIQQHLDFAVGYRRQDITFVYVSDVVQAVFLALERGRTGRRYFLSDGEVYQSTTFSDLLHKELGCPWRVRLTAPLWLLRIITCCGELSARLTGKVTALNSDKYNIMRQRNWRCDIGPARRELGYEPKVGLAEGVRRSVRWYREHGWL
ncbi:MAG: NAD-dependent epimerase/dehydratase family protein [Prevotella sp.]|nr:NAD-dependent epimerase/dehydratase family protein [Prevotella sp.]